MTKSAFAWMLLCSVAVVAPALAGDCVDFKWDVSQERALYAGAPTLLTAAADAKSAPALSLNRLYEIKLLPQEEVTFAATPGKKNPQPQSSAGLVAFKIPAAGSYRVSLDLPVWIDVARDGMLVGATDFEGQHGCNAPHKIVVFDLTGSRPFTLQLSNVQPQSVRLTITATPVRKH